ncbi:MAG: threonine--tRNA ligase [Candidatus Aminicenantes bacterium]|nr:threonine--tRNA ligase [Candidatus Aminicenantes bacterium]
MSDVKIKIEKSVFSVEKGTSLSSLLPRVRLQDEPILAKVNGYFIGLDFVLEEDMDIELFSAESEEALDVLWHSTSHLMAHAVLELFPNTQVGVGPAVENGFYYDFLRDVPFTLEDLDRIEEKMEELARRDIPIEKVEMPKEKALKLFKEQGQDLKVELIQEKGGEMVTCYRQDSFIDFCRGPHLSSTGLIKHFKLLSLSGAYWKGDEKGIQLQRIYGTSFFSKAQLKEYLDLLEEAKKRDHRKLGPELDLYSIHEDLGPGLILWHPKGSTVRRLIEDYWREEHIKDGYDFVYSPHVAKLDIWRKSGHTEHYDAMFPFIQLDNVEYQLKPMNCPFHIMVFNSRQKSYRDLPLRWAELGTVYRFERSGVLHGLLRVRGFTQDDAHIFCRADQLEDEIRKATRLAMRMLKTFGFEKFDIYLSTRPENYTGKLEDWNQAEKALERSLKDEGLPYKVDEGEGVFYGPKIDIKIKDAIGRSWQCTTIQLDFNLAERFDLNYIGEDGQAHRPFLIHRALLGSLERFFGILIEHYKGDFPLWLAPIQVKILPIADRHNDYAHSLDALFKEGDLRSEVDMRREKVGYKIREAEMLKIPFILVVGDKEVEQKNASLRVHSQGDKGQINPQEFLEKSKKLIKNKSISLNI